MITLEAYWKGRDVAYAEQLTDEIRDNASATVQKVNLLLSISGMTWIYEVNSGWRPLEVNDRTRNSASHSSHLTAEACDIRDDDGDLDKWCLANLNELVRIGLWLEHPGWTNGPKGWCHVQTRPPGWPPRANGPRVFVPNANAPMTSIYGNEPIYA